MGHGLSKQQQQHKDKVPAVKVSCCTVHEYIAEKIRPHGSKVAQVDSVTGETVTFDAILERSTALAAGLSARGLRAGDAAVIMGENNIHYPWVLLGVLQTGAAAHLLDPRSSPNELQHALTISMPTMALVSSSVSQMADLTAVLRDFDTVRSVLVWGGAGDADGDDLPDGIAPLERILISPAKSASSVPCSPGAGAGADAATPKSVNAATDVSSDVPVLTVKTLAPGIALTPDAPPPTPSSIGATFGDSCSPSAGSSPLQKILVHAVDGLPQPRGGSSVALILSSSGSTGLPKGVILTHENILTALGLTSTFVHADDIVCGLSPYFHAFGGVLMMMALCVGARVVALGRFSMAAMLNTVEEYKVTVIHVVSSLLVSMGKHPVEGMAKLRSLRRIWSGAAQISPLVQSAIQARLPRVRLAHSYGMTETTFTAFTGEVRADKPGSPGLLVPTMECKVIDPDTGKPLPVGARGELCFRGPMVTQGYLRNEEATREAFDEEGWLISGDLGFADEDGYYYIVERLKDVLKYNGHQVSPSELEALLATHPAVREAAVIGEPHEYGDAPRALVILTDGQHVTAAELQEFIQGKVAPHKQLRGGITFVTEPLPRTASGKLQRRKLRALLEPNPDDSMTSASTAENASAPNSPAAASAIVSSASAPGSSSNVREFLHPVNVEAAADAKSSTPAGNLTPAAVLDRQTQETVVSPEFKPHAFPRLSVVSASSLSTIYSNSPQYSPDSLSSDGFSIGSHASVAALREAAQVPLPNSPAAFRSNESLGSGPMDMTSPLGSHIQQGNEDSPSLP